MSVVVSRVTWIPILCTIVGMTIGMNVPDQEDHPAVREATEALDAAVGKAVGEYVAQLREAAKAVGAEGDYDTAAEIKKKADAIQTHGLSLTPDPTAKAKKILLRHIFRKTDGAILDFRSDYTAYGRHNGKTTNWVMTDSQTVITGATDPTKPLYIYKFDRTLSRGVVYKYQPVTNEKRHSIARAK